MKQAKMSDTTSYPLGYAEDPNSCRNRKQERAGSEMSKLRVAFICVHNSCRSQIAEALGKQLAANVFESYSAGTETKPQINQDAVRIMRDRYRIDMEQEQRSKMLEELPQVDIVITMGCNVSCPFLPCTYREDWGLDDPSGKNDAEFIRVIETIKVNMITLKKRISEGLI